MQVKVKEFAKIVGVPLKTIYRWKKRMAKENDIIVKTIGKPTLIDVEKAKAWIKNNPMEVGRPKKI